MRQVVVPTESGPRTTTSLPFPGEEFLHLCGYILRGLVWHQYGVAVPNGYYVEAVSVSAAGLQFFRSLLEKSPEHQASTTVAGGALSYDCTRNSEDPAFSVWNIRFYDQLGIAGDDGAGGSMRLHIYGITGPPEARGLMDEFKRAARE